MKANKRVRDLRRRSKTGVRRVTYPSGVPTTAALKHKDEKGHRVENIGVRVQ